VAFAATGRIDEAQQEQELFRSAVKRVPLSRTIFNNTCIDILAVAEPMLQGEIAYRCGDYDAAFASLRLAVEKDDNLPYDEPWGWMQPARHALGALLLEQGRVREAMDVYAADLGLDESLPRALIHPNNIWALHGYHECLVKMGRHAEARIIRPQLQLVVAMADVPIHSSCFCRLQTAT
jgi:tetratricopeptide (TPR) repeat protein